jgi:hypothetical protein
MYFFWRWQRSGESFPCFRTSTDWYRIKVLKRDDKHLIEPLSVQTASDWTSRIFKDCGIQSSKIQHAGRVKGSQIAEDRGVTEEQVKSFSPHLSLLTIFSTDLTQRAVASRSDDWVLSHHSPSSLYAGSRRLRPRLRWQLLPTPRDLLAASLAASPRLARSGSLTSSPSGPPRRRGDSGCQLRHEELPRAFGAAPCRLPTGIK